RRRSRPFSEPGVGQHRSCRAQPGFRPPPRETAASFAAVWRRAARYRSAAAAAPLRADRRSAAPVAHDRAPKAQPAGSRAARRRRSRNRNPWTSAQALTAAIGACQWGRRRCIFRLNFSIDAPAGTASETLKAMTIWLLALVLTAIACATLYYAGAGRTVNAGPSVADATTAHFRAQLA